ncbi:MAG: hypothetical protein KAJ24_05455 [Candidatus Aenigmarchaeota archaeon]|nr:hypothetical protein [Candidatus Aenigmarchaeota archaeon]
MTDMQMWFMGLKARKAQMDLAAYGIWFLMAIAILMMVILYYAFMKSV